MLRGPGGIALGVAIVLAGCVGPGNTARVVSEPDECLLVGPPSDAPAHREVFNVTEDVAERLPTLSLLFDEPGHALHIDCTEGLELFRALDAEGADVVLLDQVSGHNAYLRRGDLTLHATLQATA